MNQIKDHLRHPHPEMLLVTHLKQRRLQSFGNQTHPDFLGSYYEYLNKINQRRFQ